MNKQHTNLISLGGRLRRQLERVGMRPLAWAISTHLDAEPKHKAPEVPRQLIRDYMVKTVALITSYDCELVLELHKKQTPAILGLDGKRIN